MLVTTQAPTPPIDSSSGLLETAEQQRGRCPLPEPPSTQPPSTQPPSAQPLSTYPSGT